MSHYRHPSLIEPAALLMTPATAVAVTLGRNAFISHLRHHHPLSARANPYSTNDRHHDLWFAAYLTEASDLLDLLAADRAAGSFIIHG